MNNRTGRIEQGMKLAADLPEIMPSDADDRIKPIYEDIERALRVPFVNLIFRVLANFPDYFVPAWQAIAPVIRSTAFEEAADRLRACAALDQMPNDLQASVPEEDKLRGFNDSIHYVLPKLLLIVTLLEEGRSSSSSGSSAGYTDIPLGVAEGATKVEMLDPAEAPPPLSHLFDRITKAHGHPLVFSYFRALAQWPDLLESLWDALEPIVGSPPYEQRKDQLIASAAAEAEHLSGGGLIPAAPSGAEGDKIRSLLSAFRRKFIPEMLIDAVFIKAMLDGPTSAKRSPFSVRG